jgi:DNA-binding NarL/FixJ family response regulator
LWSAIDSVRAKSTRWRGSQALEAWHPLAGARWTLVDSFEENGRRYVVARENQADVPGVEVLTDRERQVVIHAALGLTNKEIAYTLDISPSTVRVLMCRAAERLGVQSRSDVIAHVGRWSGQPDGERKSSD